MLLRLLLLLRCSVLLAHVWDNRTLNTAVWLSGAAYCDKHEYPNMILDGYATGFEYRDTLYDPHTDVQGYIGVMPSTKTVYVVIRGSSSIMNWLDDFEVSLVDYNTYPECECHVHRGFYHSAMEIHNKTIDIVRVLRKEYPKVVVSGHSYGASVGTLLAMELIRAGIETDIYNYGQPRVGDAVFAEFANKIVPEYWRMTHYKDIVPHLPLTVMNYVHSCREIYEDETGELTVCSNLNCEDPSCANQHRLVDENADDHMYYLGHHLACEDSIISMRYKQN